MTETSRKKPSTSRNQAERFLYNLSSATTARKVARNLHGPRPHPLPAVPRRSRSSESDQRQSVPSIRTRSSSTTRGPQSPRSARRLQLDRDAKKPAEKGLFLQTIKQKIGIVEVEYDPYENRVVKFPTSNTETLLHLLKGSLGTGILAMPQAFSNSGYLMGVIGTVFIGVLCTYCIHILLDSCYVLCKRQKMPSLTYTSAAEAALSEGPGWCKVCAPFSRHIVNSFLLLFQIGTCCVYVVFVSENIHFVMQNYFKMDTTTIRVMLFLILPLILINWVRDLKYLAPFSAIANVVTIVSFGIILYYIFREEINVKGRSPTGNVLAYPLFFGTVLFALEAIGVILPLENEMKTPRDFSRRCGVLNQAMFIIVVLYVGMGLFGYLQFGNDALGSITLNLPSETEIMASLVQILLAAAIFVTHALACYVAIDIIWNEYVSSRLLDSKHRCFWEYLMRTSVVLITIGIAAGVPVLGLFISLIGALCLSVLGLCFPAIIQSCTYWNYVSRKERYRMLVKNALVVMCGLLCFVVGTYTALTEIIHNFSGP